MDEQPDDLWDQNRYESSEQTPQYPYSTPFTYEKAKAKLSDHLKKHGAPKAYDPVVLDGDENAHSHQSFKHHLSLAQQGWKSSADIPLDEQTGFISKQSAVYNKIIR